MAEVGDKLAGIRRLVVPPQAVVTPSVRDELLRRNVTLVYGQPAVSARPERVHLVLAVLGSRYEPGSLLAAVESEPVQAELRRYDCLVAATDELAREVADPDTLGAIISTYPAMAVCLANRHRGVRAVWGLDPARLLSDLESVGANLLVLDPRSLGPFPLRQMVVQFCRRGPGECPETLRER
jgi:hypothetical protein